MLSGKSRDQVILRSGAEALTVAQVESRATALQAQLRRAGVTTLGLLADNSCDWVIADLACREASICLVPLPTFFSNQQLRHALASCAVAAVLSDQPATCNARIGSTASFVDAAGLESCQLALLAPSAGPVAIPPGTGKITFTSGSTGQPKGVCLANANLARQARVLSELVAVERPRHLCLLPLSTLLENVAGVYAPLYAGGEILVPSTRALGFDGSTLAEPLQLLAEIAALRPETLILLPQLLGFLTDAAQRGWPVPGSLRYVAVGGARVTPEAITAARRCGIPVYEGYGLSECASVVSLNTRRHDRPGTCGRPLPSLAVSVAEGEVMVTGSAMLGYVNDRDSWGQHTIATGDIGALDDAGFLSISGRKKNLLISSYGRNIAPEWVESELLANPILSEAVVLGDARPYCVALLSVASEAITDATIDTWIEQVNRELPDYARIGNWCRLPQPLRLQPDLVTANGRPRRDRINTVMQDTIAALYRESVATESVV